MITNDVTGVRPHQDRQRWYISGSRWRALLTLLPCALVAVLSACAPAAGSGSGGPNMFGAVPGPFSLTIRVVSATDDPATLQMNTALDVRREDSISHRMAMFGPDGRLYVVDSLPAEILAYELIKSPFSASFLHVATYSYQGLVHPTVIEFSPEGDLWVVDAGTFDAARPLPNRLYRFADPSGVRGTRALKLEAEVTLRSDPSAGFAHTEVSALLFDRSGRLWYTDFNDSSVGRIDAPGGLNGTVAALSPDLVFSTKGAAAQGPSSLTFDPHGGLYLGFRNRNVVLRYDDPGSIADGTAGAQPSAVISLDPPALDTSLVGFDHTGALIIVVEGQHESSNGELVRVERPWEGTGDLTLRAASRYSFPFHLSLWGGAFKMRVDAVQSAD